MRIVHVFQGIKAELEIVKRSCESLGHSGIHPSLSLALVLTSMNMWARPRWIHGKEQFTGPGDYKPNFPFISWRHKACNPLLSSIPVRGWATHRWNPLATAHPLLYLGKGNHVLREDNGGTRTDIHLLTFTRWNLHLKESGTCLLTYSSILFSLYPSFTEELTKKSKNENTNVSSSSTKLDIRDLQLLEEDTFRSHQSAVYRFHPFLALPSTF